LDLKFGVDTKCILMAVYKQAPLCCSDSGWQLYCGCVAECVGKYSSPDKRLWSTRFMYEPTRRWLSLLMRSGIQRNILSRK